MSLILNQADWEEIRKQAPQLQPNELVLSDFEELWVMPERFVRGYDRGMALSPGVWLNFLDWECHQDFRVKMPVHEHEIQILIPLSGSFYNSIHPTFSKVRSYFSGSGISPAYIDEFQTGQRLTVLGVLIEPEVLESYLMTDGQFFSLQKQLFRGEDWKVSFYPTVTPAMRSLAHQMWNAPYSGAIKRMYLQAKVFELLALHLDLISADLQPTRSSLKLKPKTVTALYHAKDILTNKLEHPPSLSQLAQKVGVSPRTLNRGFPKLFNTTVVSYLIQQRLNRAEILLREGKHTVAEVAILVGYGNIGHFSMAFKRKFGITPRQCLAGEKARFE